MALDRSVANKCGFQRKKVIPFSELSDAKLNKPKVPAFIYREILCKPVFSLFNFTSSDECYGSSLCLDKSYVKQRMQKYYPNITIYTCSSNSQTGATTLLNLTD